MDESISRNDRNEEARNTANVIFAAEYQGFSG
jgi:hypothetical protein